MAEEKTENADSGMSVGLRALMDAAAAPLPTDKKTAPKADTKTAPKGGSKGAAKGGSTGRGGQADSKKKATPKPTPPMTERQASRQFAQEGESTRAERLEQAIQSKMQERGSDRPVEESILRLVKPTQPRGGMAFEPKLPDSAEALRAASERMAPIIQELKKRKTSLVRETGMSPEKAAAIRDEARFFLGPDNPEPEGIGAKIGTALFGPSGAASRNKQAATASEIAMMQDRIDRMGDIKSLVDARLEALDPEAE